MKRSIEGVSTSELPNFIILLYWIFLRPLHLRRAMRSKGLLFDPSLLELSARLRSGDPQCKRWIFQMFFVLLLGIIIVITPMLLVIQRWNVPYFSALGTAVGVGLLLAAFSGIVRGVSVAICIAATVGVATHLLAEDVISRGVIVFAIGLGFGQVAYCSCLLQYSLGSIKRIESGRSPLKKDFLRVSLTELVLSVAVFFVFLILGGFVEPGVSRFGLEMRHALFLVLGLVMGQLGNIGYSIACLWMGAIRLFLRLMPSRLQVVQPLLPTNYIDLPGLPVPGLRGFIIALGRASVDDVTSAVDLIHDAGQAYAGCRATSDLRFEILSRLGGGRIEEILSHPLFSDGHHSCDECLPWVGFLELVLGLARANRVGDRPLRQRLKRNASDGLHGWVDKLRAHYGSRVLSPEARTLQLMQTWKPTIEKRLEDDAQQPFDPFLFVCYRRKDTGDLVRRLAKHLDARLEPGQVFVDLHIEAGEEWEKRLISRIEKASHVFAFAGPDLLDPGDKIDDEMPGFQGSYMMKELEIMLGLPILVIPVAVDGGEIPKSFQSNQGKSIQRSRWEEGLQSLLRVLERDGFVLKGTGT